jgi:uncharacterized protein YceK
MKTLTVALALCLLSGCVPIIKQFAPSLEYCDDVQYVRKGNDFAVMATCKVR